MSMLYEMDEEEDKRSKEALVAVRSDLKRRRPAASLRRARNVRLNVGTIGGPNQLAFEDGLSRVRVLLLVLAEMAEKAEPQSPRAAEANREDLG